MNNVPKGVFHSNVIEEPFFWFPNDLFCEQFCEPFVELKYSMMLTFFMEP